MNSTQALITYDAILAITGEMLTAAQNNKWDQLILLEQECRKLTEMLIKHDPEPILDKELLQKKVRIISQILADDAQIRAITEPWLIKLQDMLNTNGRTRSLQQAYQPINNI
ncbi:MAG: flagellar protein FliT [Nitrosomonas sp.]|uniref:flagellar protein FliT n=1 Tax=Nitrosomonas sp. TaxID=42353 RepID=UPI002727CCC5|nr:flagellar protein FliT [Nitrosomonas sp.]MDO8894254.1 flagellar protein FliT [Nitrosomonas sp.]MDO9469113.1 flagellar protein FliT [Nitrosomonas sp.]MDP1548595.1 flagellar protein FliT [Nitrosomonas sp.]MDP1787518.1 flagellar protein FliT [Nitrosomonas sp.]MDP1933694.1 flagellar protein FliT [Nitrosomonas sp.]